MMKSVKNALKRAKQEAQAVPREMKAIQEEYAKLLARSGEAQYQAFIYTKALSDINKQLEQLNFEASARQQLDKEVKASVVASPEVGA